MNHNYINLQNIYRYFLKYPYLRRRLRLARAKMQSLSGYSDPFYDLAEIASKRNADLFMDIGCHHGETLLRFIEAGLSARVAAFDPLPQNLSHARQTLARHSNIEYIQSAISDADGSAQFYVNKNEQTSSLLDNACGNTKSFYSDTQHDQCINVPVLKLDTWVSGLNPKPTRIVIKCDTQGAEGKVISGGLDTLSNSVIAFYAEVMLGNMYEGQASFDDLRALLEGKCGMMLKNIYPCLHDHRGQAVQMDALWIRAKN